MSTLHFIKTNSENVAVEYHEYQDVQLENWKPKPDHILVEKPAFDPVGHVYDPDDGTFSKEFAPGFEPDDD